MKIFTVAYIGVSVGCVAASEESASWSWSVRSVLGVADAS